MFIENLFFLIIYCLIGSFFFSYFHNDSFNLYINGNGGFVGSYINQTFINSLISPYENFVYYILILITLILFLLSINFNLKIFLERIKNFINKKDNKNYTNKDELISQYIPQEEIKNLIQEDLPFIKAENTISHNKRSLIYHQLIF